MEEKVRAYSRGWKLSAELCPLSGRASVGVIFGPGYRRFDVASYFNDRHELVVGATSQISPKFRYFAEQVFQKDYGSIEIEMQFHPETKSADIYVNGNLLCSKYLGHEDFNNEDRGVVFGVAAQKRQAGDAEFKRIRFETE